MIQKKLKKIKNLLTIFLTRNIFVAVLLDLLDIDSWRRLLYALCTEIPKQRTLRRFLPKCNIVKKNDLEIMSLQQGFLIFVLHGLRNSQVRKENWVNNKESAYYSTNV